MEYKATEKQKNMICYQMALHKMPTDIPISFLDEIDLGTASTIIKAFLDNQPEAAYNQLKHLYGK